MSNRIEVLDKGYVRLVKHMGTDLDPINAAKVSFDKESTEFGEREARLLAFLRREEHSSVFRHSALTFEIYLPLMIARQLQKYIVASTFVDDQLGWNESSRRYVTEGNTYYVPARDEWRSAPENKKQGSGDPINAQSIGDQAGGDYFTARLEDLIRRGEELYEAALERGIAPEQARLFLPAYGLYVRLRWTASLAAVMHMLEQRLAHDSQKEFQLYARAIRDLTKVCFPVTVGTLSVEA